MQELKEKLEKLKLSDPGFDNTTRARSLVALAALAGMFLPWVWLDGDSSSLNAAELLAHGLTNPERGAMAGVSFPGTMALLFIPPAVIILAVLGFIRAIRGEYPLLMNAAGAALPLVLLVLSKPVTSSDDHSVLGIPVSHAGAIVVSICHASLLIHGALHRASRIEGEDG